MTGSYPVKQNQYNMTSEETLISYQKAILEK